jgi:PIN domain nuclease of toxin-antitoxin system
LGGEFVIVLDTHIWVWWANDAPELRPRQRELIHENVIHGLGVSAISCWEVAKLVAKQRLVMDLPVGQWVATALKLPGVVLLPLSPEIAVESSQLPEPFHADPADQILAATCRVLDCSLLTADRKLLAYAHLKTLR